jgi:hypothetical protein
MGNQPLVAFASLRVAYCRVQRHVFAELDVRYLLRVNAYEPTEDGVKGDKVSTESYYAKVFGML